MRLLLWLWFRGLFGLWSGPCMFCGFLWLWHGLRDGSRWRSLLLMDLQIGTSPLPSAPYTSRLH